VIPRGSQVKIFVSSGGQIKIPSAGVVGETPENAIATLVGAGFSTATAPQPSQTQLFQRSDTIPAGRVLGTIPAVGKSASKDSAILLIISTGP
jgi:beta-lactam-binding protein with PASTA domain